MYIDETSDNWKLWDYVGMVDVDPMGFLYSLENLEMLKLKAIEFREAQLKYAPYGDTLQAMELGVIAMIPYSTKWYRTGEDELYVSGFGLKGIHYFKRRW